MRVVTYLLLFGVLVTCCKATGILDLLKWGLDLGTPTFGREAEPDESSLEDEEENCLCENGLSCNCCMKLNFTLIDFGENGCVNIQYAAFDQSLEFNMTFGENELHTQSVDVDNIEPVCMNLVGDVPLAYICASLSKFKLEHDHMRGCIHLEPTLLGEAQARYFVGCFGYGSGNETRSGNSTATLPVTGPGKRPSSKSSNKTSSAENTSTGSGQASGESSGSSQAASGEGEEEEEDEENTSAAANGGFIEQGANILSNIFYYFSPDSGEEDDKEDDKNKLDKIILVSSTEIAAKEEIPGGSSELPPPTGSEEYDSDVGEEEEEEEVEGEGPTGTGPSGSAAASGSVTSAETSASTGR